MHIARKNKLAGALALSIGLVTTGCGGMPTNTSLYSTKQPVVERTNFTFDVQTNGSGLPIGEQSRLNGWFEAMDLRYGDRVTIEDPSSSPAVAGAVSDLANRYGILVSQTAPTTAGYLQPGQARVVITRSSASVPGCPDWSAKSDMNYNNATSPGYGCAVNGNLAAMVANPQDLLEGQKGSGETIISTGTKAIDSYREAPPSGSNGLLDAQGQGGE
ncbi:pilus assembly protein CpaD [Erythrobacter insulae]|uniref:Pilus assembly protein CpaD n=1 Tax=Erythrobacter insulae TaxID=2584124 RepID=A0A547P9D0_9SPHN|nr:CpaD family pilus assembly protein [Erythrobacter insulae]TRD10758.1 pilus assembly protein CpaD [Erythrobacter insulae]